MGLQNTMQNHGMSVVLSTDAKPRLKWTPELHQRFIDAVNQLGGADSCVFRPTYVLLRDILSMVVVEVLSVYFYVAFRRGDTQGSDESDGNSRTDFIPPEEPFTGIKYRLGKNQQAETYDESEQHDDRESPTSLNLYDGRISEVVNNQMNESLQKAQALQMQMEVERELREQIEVQKHLQLRIEAQGKYLQKVLKKAQEMLADYNSSSLGVEQAKAELSQVVSMVSSGRYSSPLSELTEVITSSPESCDEKQTRGVGYSMESSSLTSSESSGRKEEKEQMTVNGLNNKYSQMLILPPLLDSSSWMCDPNNQSAGRKRSKSAISDEISATKRLASSRKKTGAGLSNLGLLDTLDLNSQYQKEVDLSPNAIDLNSKGIEQLDGLFQ